MNKVTIRNYDMLQRIARHLIVNASFLDNPGLFHGKMGVILALSMMGRAMGDTLYENSAGDLLDELFEDLSEDVPTDFEDGLSGIGWGIHWLLRNDYVQGEPNEVLADIDRKIMERDLRRMHDGSFRFGMGGIAYYIEARLEDEDGMKSLDPQYIFELTEIKSRGDVVLELNWPSEFWTAFDKMDATKFVNCPLGLENGCAGYIVNALKDQCNINIG